MKNLKIKNFSFIIGLILFGIILWQSDLGILLSIVKKINWWWVLGAYLLDYPEILVKALVWKNIMKKQKIIYSLKDCFTMYMSGTAMGFFTPGKFGEFARALFLKKDGHTMGKSLVSVFIDRLSALIYLLIAGYIGALALVDSFFERSYWIVIILFLSVIAIWIIFKKGWHKLIFAKVFGFLLSKKVKQQFNFIYTDFIAELKKYKFWDYVKYVLLTAVAWLIYYFEFYFLARAAGINQIPFGYLSLAITVSFFFTFLPISFLGIGTREAALLLFLAPFGVSPEIVIVLAELALLDSLWTAGTGLLFWLIKPIPFSKDELK